MVEQNWIQGLWKFNENVSGKHLNRIGHQLLLKNKQYIRIYIVKTSNRTKGLGFTYELKDKKTRKRKYELFLKKMETFMTKSLGSDFIGYEISCPVWTIK